MRKILKIYLRSFFLRGPVRGILVLLNVVLCLALFWVLNSFLFSLNSLAAPFQFSIGDTIQVTSDKGYRYGGQNRFEVVGNVVILHYDEALYGETGHLELDTGEIEVKGNVRYINPLMTMYGSQLNFNAKSGLLAVKNARILARGYTVQGEYMTRKGPREIFAEDAEYTTCRDCPESWSVYGKKVRIMLGEYIHITHALIKTNGVSIMYLPYMVIPIKKNRQTGLLFPQFSLSFKEGFHYRQPWFWAISDNKDMTLVPWSKGIRGLGNEIEYRHVLGESRWFEFHSLQAFDRIYLPGKENDDISGNHYLRQFSDYEHHYQVGNFLTTHAHYQNTRELDTLADFSSFTQPLIPGAELGAGTFIDMKSSLIDVNLEGYFNRNVIVPNPKAFDHNYVQILPRVNLDITPITLLHTSFPLLQNIAVGANSTYTLFKQNHVKEESYIRNAHRVTANPYVNLQLGHIGPFDFKTNVQWDSQFYRFPNESDKFFRKKGTIFLTEMSFEIDKIFGLAYNDKVSLARVQLEGLEKKENDKKEEQEKKDASFEGEDENSPPEELIGNIPSYEDSYIEDHVTFSHSSYRHSILFNFRHHYTADQDYSGNRRFEKQIESGTGLFDYQDAPRKLRHVIGSLSTKTDISQRNTLEFRLFNSLFKKDATEFSFMQDERFLRDNFSYSKLAYLNLSQGMELQSGEPRFIDKLTRLFIQSGFPLFHWNVSLEDYYFYQNQTHKFTGSINRKTTYIEFYLTWKYESITDPPAKSMESKIVLRPWPTVHFEYSHSRDLTNNKSNYNNYVLLYAPWNNCWKLDLGLYTNEKDKQITFNFFVNFAENKFTSLLQPVSDPSK